MSSTRSNEQGIMSILVTMIMMVVISLIVLGFAQISRRNQREALDNQISTQAYYAAESGVNAAVNYLTGLSASASDSSINTIGSCNTFINTLETTVTNPNPHINVLDSSSNTRYTCLMVDTVPTTLSLAPLTQGGNSILYFANTDKEPFTQLKFSWTPQTNSPFPLTTCSGSGPAGGRLPPYDQWDCAYGILRLDLADAVDISNTSLENDQGVASFYLVPSYQSGSLFMKTSNISWPPKVQPADPALPAGPSCSASTNDCPVQIIPVSCSSSGCSLQMDITGGSAKYYARLTMMYQDSSALTIAGGDTTHHIDPVSGVGASFAGGQAIIDSTGQAQDELRRVEVRIPITASSGVFSAYGLQTTQSVCKQIEGSPGVYVDNCPDHP